MNPTKFFGKFALALLLVSFAVISLHLIKFSPSSYLARSLLDSLHLPGFAAIAVATALMLSRQFARNRAVAITAGLCLGLAAISEASQFLTARDADFGDLISDLVGIVAGLAIFLTIDYRRSRPDGQTGNLILLSTTAFIALAALSYTAWLCAMITLRWIALPALLTFDQSWENSIHLSYPDNALTIVQAPEHWPATSQRVARLLPQRVRFPGLIIDPYPDWRGYDRLSFLVASDSGKTERFRIRIHDKSYGQGNYYRFDKIFEARQNPERLTIPFSDLVYDNTEQAIDLSAIVEIRIRSLDRRDPWLIVDDFRLEKE